MAMNTAVCAKGFLTKAPYCIISFITPGSSKQLGIPDYLLACGLWFVMKLHFKALLWISKNQEHFLFASKESWDCRNFPIQGWELQCCGSTESVTLVWPRAQTKTHQESFRICLLKLCSGKSPITGLLDLLQVKNLLYIYLLMYLLLWCMEIVISQSRLQQFPRTKPLKIYLPLK